MKTLTTSYIDKLKNKDLTIEQAPGKQSNILTETASTSSKPKFVIKNSKRILLLLGHQNETRVIIESFLQANASMRSCYKCVAMHCCTRENKISCDAYFIVKHIILQIVKSVPAIQQLLLLQDHNFFEEFLQVQTQ